jgi:hypothetical protein
VPYSKPAAFLLFLMKNNPFFFPRNPFFLRKPEVSGIHPTVKKLIFAGSNLLIVQPENTTKIGSHRA